MWKEISSSRIWLIGFNVLLFGFIIWVIYSSHVQAEQRIQKCTAQCQYDYTKPTLHPKAGGYDLCVKGCDVAD